MIRKYIILILIILFSSCEKSRDNENTLLKFFGDAYEDVGYSVAEAGIGYVIAGQVTSITRTGNNIIENEKSIKKMAIIKTGIDGNTIWKHTFGDRFPAVGTKILALDDGSLICTGYLIDTLTLKRDIFVVKMDSDGTNSIQKRYENSEGNQYGTDIIQTQEGFLILGTTDVERQPLTDSTGNEAGKKDILLLRVNSNLDYIAAPYAIGFPKNDEGFALKSDFNGGYTVVGTTEREVLNLNQLGNNIIILRINANGSPTQPRILGGPDDEYAADLEVLNDGYLIAGTVGSEGSKQTGHVWKLSDDIYADPIIDKPIKISTSSGTELSYSINAICRYKTNSFLMAGKTGTGSSLKMIIFVLDTDGSLENDMVKIEGSTGSQVAYDVISDDSNNIIAVGKNSYENNSMISLLKFRF